MKRFLPFILISSVLLQFFAPFTVDIKPFNPKINLQIVLAEDEGFNLNFQIDRSSTDKTATIKVTPVFDQNGTMDIKGWEEYSYMKIFKLETSLFKGNELVKKATKERFKKDDVLILKADNLIPNSEYKVVVNIYEGAVYDGEEGKYDSYLFNPFSTKEATFTTNTAGDQTTDTTTENITAKKEVQQSTLPECGFRNIGGCIARIFYYVLFVPTSFLFGLAGTVMDFTIMYSVSDSSYRTPFVSEGWQVVRDLCNMFFIFILLYIALTTILDSGGSKNKASVVNVIIIGLLINFSLFATHLIIDASNIMARVFYNPKVIVIGEKDASGEINNTQDEELEHIPLSEGIVAKINPQRLLLQENQGVAKSKATSITNKANINTNEDAEDKGISSGTFILVTIMASIVNFVGMMTFLTISLSFIGRVIGLWIAMVLSPLAFLSYTVPETKNWSYVGWSSWWSETTKAAFMAPVFVFFMYIIVMFLESNMGLDLLTKSSSLTDFNKILSVIVPFIVIIVLLKQAEKISTKLAGEVAGAVTKSVGNIGAKTGGLALGGALGLGAFAMRSTVGKMGASIANSSKLQDAEAKGGISGWGARQLRNVGGFAGKSSFDVKNTKIGQDTAKNLGVEGLKKGKTGGYVDYQSRVEKKVTERADTLKLSDAKTAEQDAAAKDYNDKYQKSMYAAKTEMENDRLGLKKEEFEKKHGVSIDTPFNEKEYKEKYKNDIKEQEKNKRIQELASKNKPFSQKEQDKFEKEYTEKHKNDGKSSADIYKERVKTYKESVKQEGVWGANDGTMARIDKTLKDKSKDPDAEKPVTHKENFLADRKIKKAEDIKNRSKEILLQNKEVREALDKETENIGEELAEVAELIGGNIDKNKIDKKDISQAMNVINDMISKKENSIKFLNEQLALQPGNPTLITSLTKANAEKKKYEVLAQNIPSVLERKGKNREKITSLDDKINKQKETINRQDEVIEKENDTMKRYEKEQSKTT